VRLTPTVQPWSAGLKAGRLALAGMLLVGTFAACGHKGPPLPPLRVRPTAITELTVRQRGERVIISLDQPGGRTDGSEYEQPVVLRLSQVVPPVPGSSRAGKGKVREIDSWVIPQAEWKSYFSRGRLEIPLSIKNLRIQPSLDGSGIRKIAFVAEVQEGKRKKGAPGAQVMLTLCTPPGVPDAVKAVIAPGGVQVSWGKPAATDVQVHLYRAAGKSRFPEKPYQKLSGNAEDFLDEGVVMGKPYRYQVRFGVGEQSLRCESEPGSAEVLAEDKFPPKPPEGLAAAAERTRIRIFWLPGTETDLAGYKVYRREGFDNEEGAWLLLTPESISDTTYADSNVKSGVSYVYAVTAVDNATSPNESARSDEAKELFP
jgi:predicted small lipoprotein YifL